MKKHFRNRYQLLIHIHFEFMGQHLRTTGIA